MTQRGLPERFRALADALEALGRSQCLVSDVQISDLSDRADRPPAADVTLQIALPGVANAPEGVEVELNEVQIGPEGTLEVTCKANHYLIEAGKPSEEIDFKRGGGRSEAATVAEADEGTVVSATASERGPVEPGDGPPAERASADDVWGHPDASSELDGDSSADRVSATRDERPPDEDDTVDELGSTGEEGVAEDDSVFVEVGTDGVGGDVASDDCEVTPAESEWPWVEWALREVGDLPPEVGLADLKKAVKLNKTIQGVAMQLDIERGRARTALKALGLLPIVVGGEAGVERPVADEDIEARIRESVDEAEPDTRV